MTARRIAWAMFYVVMAALIAFLFVPRWFPWQAYGPVTVAALLVGTSARIRLRMTGGKL